MTGQILVDPDEYLGAVKIDGNWRFFHDVLSMWILDYHSYDPEYVPTPGGWREGILKVDESNANSYCQAMESREIEAGMIPLTKSVLGGQMPLTFVINFDERLFVNGWHDNIPIHEYAPEGWRAIEADPYNYLPTELKVLWSR